MNIIDLFDDLHSTKSIEECFQIPNEKGLILIESLPWLFLRTSEGNLIRSLHTWSSKIQCHRNRLNILFSFHSETNTVMAVIPVDCLEDNSFLKNLVAISYITIRVKTLPKSETIEARVEQRSRTNVDTIKSVRRSMSRQNL